MSDYNVPQNPSLVVINDGLSFLSDYGALVLALSQKDFQTSKNIIDNLDHVDMRDDYDRTALVYAILKECEKTLDYLLCKKTNPMLRDIEGFTALHRAAQMGNTRMIKKLIKYVQKNGYDLQHFLEIRSCRGFSALYSAAVLGHKEAVALLIQYGASIRIKSHDGYTILMTLAIKGHNHIIELLLSQKYKKNNETYAIDVNEKNARGWSALHFAAYHCQKEATSMLMKYGADVNCEDEEGLTPLMVTSTCSMALFLINQGAFINKTNENGESAFTRALKNHQEKLLNLLLHAHAYVLDDKIQSLCTRELPVGLHALYIQERDEQKVAFKLLTMKHFSEVLRAYEEAQEQDNVLLQSEIKEWIEGQKSLVVSACLKNDLFQLSGLLEKGVDALQCNYRGCNIIVYCALTGRHQVTNLLLTYVPQERCHTVMKNIVWFLGYRFPHITLQQEATKDTTFHQSVLSIDKEDMSDYKDKL